MSTRHTTDSHLASQKNQPIQNSLKKTPNSLEWLVNPASHRRSSEPGNKARFTGITPQLPQIQPLTRTHKTPKLVLATAALYNQLKNQA